MAGKATLAAPTRAASSRAARYAPASRSASPRPPPRPAGRAVPDPATLGGNGGPAGGVDGPADAATGEQVFVRRVDDGVHLLRCDVPERRFDVHSGSFARIVHPLRPHHPQP